MSLRITGFSRGQLLRNAFFMIAFLLPASGLHAADFARQQEMIRGVAIDQKLGDQVPLDLEFRDELGRKVRLGDYFGKKPVLLTPVYYTCPMLCHLVLNGVVKALRVLKFVPGREFEIVAYSFKPQDKPSDAASKKEAVLKDLGHPEAGKGWHFLTGEAASVQALSEAIGFHYELDKTSGEYAHAAGVMVLTPEGKLSRYFFGIEVSPRDLKLALMESSEKRIGSAIDQLLLLCYHYDPTSGKYGLAIMNFLRFFGTLTVLGLAFFITRSLRQERSSLGGRL